MRWEAWTLVRLKHVVRETKLLRNIEVGLNLVRGASGCAVIRVRIRGIGWRDTNSRRRRLILASPIHTPGIPCRNEILVLVSQVVTGIHWRGDQGCLAAVCGIELI